MFLKVEKTTKKVKIIHWKSGEPFWTNRHSKMFTYQCDNPACEKVWQQRNRRAKKKLLGNGKHGGPIMKNHYCSVKCCHQKLEMKSRTVECAHPECDKTFHKWDCYSKKYCSNECAHSALFLDGLTCKHSRCKRSISKRNKSGFCHKHSNRGTHKKFKTILYAELGNKCVCCGERDWMYLSVDHVANDGVELRKRRSAHTRINTLLHYHRENPGSLQLLCMNCNHAKMRNGGELYYPTKFTRRQRYPAVSL